MTQAATEEALIQQLATSLLDPELQHLRHLYPAVVGEWLDALEGVGLGKLPEDRVAALVRVIRKDTLSLGTTPSAALDALRSMLSEDDQLAPVLARLEGERAQVEAAIGSLRDAVTSVCEQFEPLAADASESAAGRLVARMAETVKAVLVSDLAPKLEGVMEEAQRTLRLLDHVRQSMASPRASATWDVERLSRQLARLEAAQATVEPSALLDPLLAVVSEWATEAREIGSPETLTLVCLHALLREMVFVASADAVADPTQTEPWWWELFDLAEAQRDLPMAQYAGIRLQASRLDAEQWSAAAEIGDRLGQLAASAGATLQASELLGRAAQWYLRGANIASSEDCLGRARIALGQSQSDPLAEARLDVIEAQMTGFLGGWAKSRELLQQASATLVGLDSRPACNVRADIAFGLAACARARRQRGEELGHLQRSAQLCLEADNLPAFANTSLSFVQRLNETGREVEAMAALLEARDAALARLGPSANGPFLRMAGMLRDEWGEEVFGRHFELAMAGRAERA